MLKKDRKNLRSPILQKRINLSRKHQQYASRVIAQQLLKNMIFLRGKRIAFYMPNKGEIDTSILYKKAFAMGKECYFPILHPLKHNQMWFAKYNFKKPLQKNYLGILEPPLEFSEIIAPWTLDIVITPLVAFDAYGNRLGMGGGYYDRTFEFLRSELRAKPKLIGLAYNFQQLPLIPSYDWDIPLDMVVTEDQVYHFRQSPHSPALW